MCLYYYNAPEDYLFKLEIINILIICLLFFEIFLKMIALGIKSILNFNRLFL